LNSFYQIQPKKFLNAGLLKFFKILKTAVKIAVTNNIGNIIELILWKVSQLWLVTFFCIYRCDDNDIKNLHTHINGEVGFEPQS
jgi:hypothetical protein